MMVRHRQVACLGHELRHAGQIAQPLLAHAGTAHLQLEIGDDGEQVGIAHAFAEPVHRALHLSCAGTHSGKRVRHSAARIVVAVNAQLLAGQLARDRGHDGLHLVRQRAAVRLA